MFYGMSCIFFNNVLKCKYNNLCLFLLLHCIYYMYLYMMYVLVVNHNILSWYSIINIYS